MIKSLAVCVLILSVAIQASNLHSQNFLRTLPLEFQDAELVSTPAHLVLKLRSGQ